MTVAELPRKPGGNSAKGKAAARATSCSEPALTHSLTLNPKLKPC